MCNIARSPDLEACFDCILEGIGTFVDSIPHYIESLQYQTSGRSRRSWPTPFLFFCSRIKHMPVLVYTATCELQGQLLRNQSIRLNHDESEAARRMITLCSVDNSHRLADFTNSPSFHSDFYKLFPFFSFTLAIVLLLISRLRNLKWKQFFCSATYLFIIIAVTFRTNFMDCVLFYFYLL
jgi:hypothetical protein